MPLHWIFGCSGSGKDRYLYNTILRRSKEEAGGRYIIIVPEQFSLQTQRELVTLSDNKGIMNIDILSFARLAYRVLSEAPELNKPVLADEGKAMVVRRLLKQHAGEWKTFGGNISKPGFVLELKSLISEFMQYGVSADGLKQMIENAGNKRLLSAKLGDLLLLYKYYSEYMESRYISAEELPMLLADAAPDSEFLSGSVAAISGFNGFTPVQYKILEKLFGICRDVYIAVTIGRDADPFAPCEKHELFYMSTEIVRKCMNIAEKCGIYVEEPVWTGKDGGNIPWRFADNPEMRHLEKNLFRYGGGKGADRWQSGAVSVYEAANPYEEAEYAAWQINRLVRDGGLRYRDIAVVTGDISLYGRLLGSEFEKTGIPYFLDDNRSILYNAFIDMVLSLLAICGKGFFYGTVIKFLRNGIVKDYLGFNAGDTDILENYARLTGIRGRKAWDSEWTYDAGGDIPIKEVNEYRKRVMDLLGPFCDGMTEAETVLDYSKALYSFIAENDISGAICDMAEGYDARGMRALKKEYDQIYRIFIGIIDQMTELLGDERVSASEYAELIKAGISEASVGVIPMGTDEVIIGDIERSRLKDVKVLFFTGVNDGIIPKAVKGGGFITDAEREYLIGSGAEIAPASKDGMFNERFYIYLAATKPSEKLYISYSRKSCEGEGIRPSLFVKQVRDILGGIEIKKDYNTWGIKGKLANDGGMGWWLGGLRKCARDGFWNPASDPDWRWIHLRRMRKSSGRELFERAFFTGESSFISKEASDILYNHELVASISRLERFGACAFAHFLKYGLRLNDRPEYKIDIPDIGIILHNVLEDFSSRLSQNGLGWKDADDKMIDGWCDEICDSICARYNNGIFSLSAKNGYIRERIRRISKKTIKAVAYQMRQGEFDQKAFEISFDGMGGLASLNYDLGNGVMHLTGKIDRIDACEKDGSVYVRIVDYKSGKGEYDMDKIRNGLSLQLPVYLMAADEMVAEGAPDKKVIPAGMFYMRIDDPVLKDLRSDDEIENGIRKEFVMPGLMNKDMPVPAITDRALDGGAKTSLVVKSKTLKEAVPGRYFEYICDAVTDMVTDYGRRILDGDTAISPYKYENDTPCAYCEFASVCGFDVRMEGNSYRKLAVSLEDDIWKEWEDKYGKLHEAAEEGD